jgi:uncharacterized membrane protein
VAKDSPVTIHRNERILAYMTVTIVVLSIIAIFANLIGAGAGADLSTGIWTTVAVLPLVGLPLGMILIIALLIVSGRRRAREAASATAVSAKK